MTKYSRWGKLIHTQGGVFLAPARKPMMKSSPKHRVRVIKNATGFRYGAELGLLESRQRYAHYTWAKAQQISKKERGENRLTLSIAVSGYDENWKLDEQIYQEFTGDDLKGAITYAKEVVGDGLLRSAHITGVTRRPYAERGFGDRSTYSLAEVEREDEDVH